MADVILGMPGTWAKDYREKADHCTTKIGGLPDWPVPEMGIEQNLLKCRICGERLCLVAQVYAPIGMPTFIEERVLYIFGCVTPKCGSDPKSWRAIRAQKCHSEKQLDIGIAKPIGLREDAASVSRVRDREEEGLSLSAVAYNGDESDGDVGSTPISKISNGREEGLSNGGGFGDCDAGANGDVDLAELSRLLSEATSKASCSKKQNSSKRSKARGKAIVPKPKVLNVDADIPVVPCFYMYSQNVQPSSDVSAVCSGYCSLNIKENESPSSDQESEEKWEGEIYEYDRALGADRAYLKFKKQMDANPEQCLRYSYGGNPLLATKGLAKPDTCSLCGSSRRYEMQLMPPLLYFLHEAADESSVCAPGEWSWATLIVYTCSNSCCPSFCKGKSRSCHWVVAEEAVIIQDE